MKILNLLPLALSVATPLLCPGLSQRAYAYGGLWSSQPARIQQSAEKILFVDSPDSTVTAVIEVKYAGASPNFAWVIPVPGKPTVGVSSNVVFQRLDGVTAPQYWVEVTVEGMCNPEDDSAATVDPGYRNDGEPSVPSGSGGAVAVLDQQSVGPYDYVNITVDPTLGEPSKVATDWLTMNGYELTSLDRKVFDPYLKNGLNLLAFKLSKGAARGAVRPLVLSYESKLPSIPLRPTAVSAQADMGLLVWVFGPSQAVPENYKSLVLNEALIDWLSGPKFVGGTPPSGGSGPFGAYVSKPSNYDAIVTAAANEAGGQGFVTELGQPASQFRNMVWSLVDNESFTQIKSESYADGIDAILAADSLYRGWDGFQEALVGATTLPAGLTIEAFAKDPGRYRGTAKVDTGKFLALLDTQVVKPVADTAALLYNAPYLTRLFSTMSPAEMTVDPTFNYNFDLAQVSNVHVAKQHIECNETLNRDEAPWRIALPQSGVIAGEGKSWPVAEGSLPANLKVVALSTQGSGSVLEDNSEEIGNALRELAGTNATGIATLQPPHTGVRIGGTQSARPYDSSDDPTDVNEGGPKRAGASKCSVLHVGGGTGSALALWVPLVGVILAQRRRRSRTQLPSDGSTAAGGPQT